MLHIAFETFGYIPLEIENIKSETLNITTAKIHGVITFYEIFQTVPTGKHTISICRGTACHSEKSNELRHYLKKT